MLSTPEVAARVGCNPTTAQKWARDHGLAKPGHDYIWTDEDIKKFLKRPKPGRRWDEKEKGEKGKK
jgi:hypothetical protein